MNRKTGLAMVAVLTTALVSIPGVANAADVFTGSSSGKTHAWYDDGGNRLVVCDMVHGDGIGAYAYMGNAGFEMKVYNGCESHPVTDGYWATLQACDWVFVNGQRVGRNCSNQAGFWT